MMRGMLDCGLSEWVDGALMAGAGFLVLLLLLLIVGIAAFVNYIPADGRRDRPGPA